jgi:hypothetical protein
MKDLSNASPELNVETELQPRKRKSAGITRNTRLRGLWMNPKTSKILGWIVVGFGSLGGLAVIGLAAAYWIHLEVKAQITDIIIPDTTQITTDVEVIKSTVLAIDGKADTAIANQQKFEEIFMDYLANEANR